MSPRTKKIALAVLSVVLLAAWTRTGHFRGIIAMVEGKKTVEQRLDEYGPAARERLKPAFEEAGVEYPPKQLVLVGLKQERELQVYAGESESGLRFIKSYPVLGASGGPGPKLREGDFQVPEGIYPITFLNPNSAFHLSLRVGYPNEFDQKMGRIEGREKLGGDIMIHGGQASVGCLAMGDEAVEDLFILAADTGIENIKVILAPTDFRTTGVTPDESLPKWTGELYRQISRELKRLPPP